MKCYKVISFARNRIEITKKLWKIVVKGNSILSAIQLSVINSSIFVIAAFLKHLIFIVAQ